MRETIEVNCPLCGSNSPRPYAVEREMRMCICGDCGLLYVNPRLSDKLLMEIYSEYYHTANHWDKYIDDHELEKDWQKHTSTPAAVWENRYGQIWSQLATLLPKENIKALDFGSGTALWPGFAARKGMEIWAYDIAENVASRNAGESGVRWSIAPSIEEAGFEENSFDLITMWDVIEHLTAPRDTLASIAKYLKPGGVLFVQTPNAWWVKTKYRILSLMPKEKVASMISKYGIFLPEQHLQYYSLPTLKRQLASLGFAGFRQAYIDWSGDAGASLKARVAYKGIGIMAKLVRLFSCGKLCTNIGLSLIAVKE
ncbi:MAG: class I SAM-dependent methyltransferase [Planctomycetes bacterium]|nr:class I SAM-dependent methyltransferase [Planctomycetota bacterium]